MNNAHAIGNKIARLNQGIAYYIKIVNLILTQKKRGINWILPVAPCGDDIP
jgi:hypothetical protein